MRRAGSLWHKRAGASNTIVKIQPIRAKPRPMRVENTALLQQTEDSLIKLHYKVYRGQYFMRKQELTPDSPLTPSHIFSPEYARITVPSISVSLG